MGVLMLIAAFFGPWDAERWLGLALTLVGHAFLAAARMQLGESFSVAAEARALVTHGLYARVRNPIYLFSAIAVTGFFLYLHWHWGLLLLLVLVPLQVKRARTEAQVLEQQFGDAYRAYRAHTWF